MTNQNQVSVIGSKEAVKITAINPTKLTYKRNGVNVKVKPISNNMSVNESECKKSLEQAKIAISKYSKFIEIRICSLTNVIEFFVKKEYSKYLGYWDYSKGNFQIVAELKSLPKDLHKAYLSIAKEIMSSI